MSGFAHVTKFIERSEKSETPQLAQAWSSPSLEHHERSYRRCEAIRKGMFSSGIFLPLPVPLTAIIFL